MSQAVETDAEAAEPAPAARRWWQVSRWRVSQLDLAVVAGYLLLAGWVLRNLWAHPGQVDPVTNTSDPAFFEMALRHAVRIFTHGEHPFLTPRVNAPYGVNMMANTGLLGLTVPLVPVTLLFGPSVSFVLLLTLGLAATATAWYAVLHRHLVGHRLAAAVGGGFAGFAPGLVNHANAHPNLVAQFLIPVIIWRALTVRTVRTVRGGAVLGLLLTWQAFINEELLFLGALAAGLFVAAYAVQRRDEVRERVRPFLTGLGVAALVAGALLAYPLWFQFFGPQHYHGLPRFVLGYGADLASYPAFPKLSLAQGSGTISPQPEENTFFGFPLLVALVVIVAALWRRVAVRALAVVGLVFAGLSLGEVASWHNHVLLHHTPWGLLNNLPLFDSVVPIRLGLVLIPVIALLLAFAVRAALRHRYPGLWLAGLAAALLPLVPVPVPVQERPAVPEFFTSGAWRPYVHGDQSIVSADTSVWYGGITAMRWDTATGLSYRMTGGYFLGPDVHGKGDYGPAKPPTAVLLNEVADNGGVPAIGPADIQQARSDIRTWKAALVVLAPDAPHLDDLRTTLTALFGPGQRVSDVWLWDVRPLLS
jgi:hypothetical protein